ncbi:multidrug effflux MFS transporter [Kineosporia sp. J2-2]|uniref:Multidrug effflux MFS transporter n=1 Tax=Kineosporia corallincola TaxID=2835133 RepID=A0ABS5TD26_9ACTN|nr:multidrug effflux MFS transporter [Kineosporia corallincola]MBT0768329.1 multidrug effflux MFS transporter [Kineosporia corallincola]
MTEESTRTTPQAAHTTPPARPAQDGGVSGPVLLVLALLSAVAPFATDLYLPAFPRMTDDLSTSTTTVQLTLTAFLLGMTVGQVVFGPLSDRFGRRPPLIAGAVLCVVASAVAALAPSVGVLIAARLAQGLGGAAGMVIGRAVISDLAHGRAAAQAFSLMMIVGGVAPVVAPLVGGFLVDPIGWRGILTVVLVLAGLMLVCVLLVIRETHPRILNGTTATTTGAATGQPAESLLQKGFLAYTFAFAFGFAVMMAYISASPFLYQDMMGLGTVTYGLAFGVNALGLMVVSAVAANLTATRSPAALLSVGIVTVFASTVVFGLLVLTGVPAGWLAVPLFTGIAGLGFVMGNATALALSYVRHSAGRGSAVLGALQFGLAAVVSPLVSIRGEDTAGPLAVVMLVAATIALISMIVARRAAPAQA